MDEGLDSANFKILLKVIAVFAKDGKKMIYIVFVGNTLR